MIGLFYPFYKYAKKIGQKDGNFPLCLGTFYGFEAIASQISHFHSKRRV